MKINIRQFEFATNEKFISVEDVLAMLDSIDCTSSDSAFCDIIHLRSDIIYEVQNAKS